MQNLFNKLSGYRHIIWDWNGTLVDDATLVLSVVNAMLQEQGLAPITMEHYRNSFAHPVIDFYAGLGFDYSKYSFDQLCHDFNEKYEHGRAELNLHKDIRTLVERIAHGPWTQSILSACEEQLLKINVQGFGLESCFDNIYGLDNLHAHSKIERGRALLNSCNIPAAETVLIGDTDHDCEVATALGIDLILIAQGHQSYGRLKQLHNETLPALKAA